MDRYSKTDNKLSWFSNNYIDQITYISSIKMIIYIHNVINFIGINYDVYLCQQYIGGHTSLEYKLLIILNNKCIHSEFGQYHHLDKLYQGLSQVI